MDKKVYQLFIGKVADEIGMDKCSRLLKESSDCFKAPLKKCACNLNEAHMREMCFNSIKFGGSKNSAPFPSTDELSFHILTEKGRKNIIEFNTSIDILREHKVFNLDKIEKELGMPQGYLSKAVKNHRALPKEWEAALKNYLLNLAKNINDKMA